MDPKFLSRLWQALCTATNIKIQISATHHQNINSQTEYTIQTFVMALVTIVDDCLQQSDWPDLVSHVIHVLNNSISKTTGKTPYKLLYGRQPQHFLSLPDHISQIEYIQRQQVLRQNTADIVQLIQTHMKAYYDTKRYPPPQLKAEDLVYLKLAKPGHLDYYLDNQTKLSHIKVGPFKIVNKFNKFIYHLQFPLHFH